MPKAGLLETDEEIARLTKLAQLHCTLRRLGWPSVDATNESLRRFSRRLSELNSAELAVITKWALDEGE